MEIINYNSVDNISITEENTQNYSYSEPDYAQDDAISDEDYYMDSYNYYPDACF